MQYQEGGRLAEAEGLFRQVLERHPGHPETLQLLSALLMRMSRADAALPLLEKAKELEPDNAAHWLLLTQCLLEVGRPKEAKKIISEAIHKGLRHPMADELLDRARTGRAKPAERSVSIGQELASLEQLLKAGRYGEAETRAQALVRRHPRAGHGWDILAMARMALKHYPSALEALQRALKLNPGKAELHFNLGYVLEQLGRLEEAMAAYRRAVDLKPSLAEAHNNQGNVLKALKRYKEALAAYQRAKELLPDAAEIRLNMGDILIHLGRIDDALDVYQALLGRRPNLPEAYNGLGFALGLLDRNEEALDACRKALQLKPAYFEALITTGNILSKCMRLEEAAECYRRALEFRKDAEVYSNYGNALKDMGRIDEAIGAYRHSIVIEPSHLIARSNLIFLSNLLENGSPQELLAEARSFGEEADKKAQPYSLHGNVPDPDRILRIGLVSGDLGEHSVGHFLESVLENLDSKKVELFAYATSRRDDPLNKRLRSIIPNWCEATPADLNDQALARRIREDGIDILVDLAGHTGHNRLPVFAWKPAPVQVLWLGYLGTTGLQAIDYVLADTWALPPGEEDQFVETPWRLPETYICFSPPDVAVDVGSLPALENGYVTFGSFNNLSKATDRVVACWARVLQAVPDSRLFLKAKALAAPEVREHIKTRFGVHGISPERLLLEGQFASREEHFVAYRKVDIALDPFPYPGITTTVEGLWMGVPCLTLKGDRFISHQGESILNNAGLPDWIAQHEDDYVAKAAAFARDTESLAALRAKLRGQVLATPLFDAPRFARNLEEAFRGMWRQWCARKSG